MPTGAVAAIDIGTNSVHLLVAALDKHKQLETLFRMKRTIRLGKLADEDGHLGQEARDVLFETLREMKRESLPFEPRYIGAATHAFRQADNGKELLGYLNKFLKLNIKVVSPNDEAKLVYQGIQTIFDCKSQPTLCVDIGGGSTELIISGAGTRPIFQSIPIGCVMLTKQFSQKGQFKPHQINELKDYIVDQLEQLPEKTQKLDIKNVIMSSGTARSIAKTVRYLRDLEDLALQDIEVTLEDVYEVCDAFINAKSPYKISVRYPVSERRSEVILAGAMVLLEVMEFFDVESFCVTKAGLRDGLAMSCLKS